MKKIRKRLIFLCILISIFSVCVFDTNAQAVDTDVKGRVLFISAYSYSWSNTRAQIEGMEAGIGNSVVLDYEFMDTKRVEDEISEQLLYEGIAYRLAQVEPYDVVILGDDAAFIFAMKYREELFEGIPFVFLGVNDEDLAMKYWDDPLITGISEKLSIDKNIDFGLKLYPSAKKVVAILDDSVTGKAERKAFYKYAEQYPNLEFTEINTSSLTTNKLRQRINQLGEDSILLYMVMTEDASGKLYSEEEAARMITKNARIPTLCMLENKIGYGLLGGNVVSMRRAGEITAQIAMDIINEKKSDDIGKILDSPNVYCIDELVMKKFGLDMSLISEGTIIVNHQPSFWERNREVLIPGGILFAALLIIMSWILYDNIRRRKLLGKLEEARKIMESASQHDFLTGLPNRSKFMDDIENLVAAGTPCTIMMLDIDHFKHINDTYGHTAGDEALKQLAERLKGMQTPILTPYRFAGDEFIICLKSCQNSIVDKEVFRCSQLFSKPFILAGDKKQVGGSIGIAVFPADADNVEQLINCADDAMYQVKKNGRNSYAFYHA